MSSAGFTASSGSNSGMPPTIRYPCPHTSHTRNSPCSRSGGRLSHSGQARRARKSGSITACGVSAGYPRAVPPGLRYPTESVRYNLGMTVSPDQQQDLSRLCREFGVARLAVFGSRLHGDAGPNSDLDLLVEFVPGQAPGLFALARLAESLSMVFGGVQVDLRTPRDLSRHFRDDVSRRAEVLYAA